MYIVGVCIDLFTGSIGHISSKIIEFCIVLAVEQLSQLVRIEFELLLDSYVDLVFLCVAEQQLVQSDRVFRFE